MTSRSLQCQIYRHFWRPVVRVCLATRKNLLLVLSNAPKTLYFRAWWSSGQPKNDVKTPFFPILHHLSHGIIANASGGVLLNSRFNFHCYWHSSWSSAYSGIGPEEAAATFRDFLRERSRRVFTRVNQLHWASHSIMGSFNNGIRYDAVGNEMYLHSLQQNNIYLFTYTSSFKH